MSDSLIAEGNRKEALRLAGQAYFDRLLNETVAAGTRNTRSKSKVGSPYHLDVPISSSATSSSSSSMIFGSSSPSAQQRKPTDSSTTDVAVVDMDDSDLEAFNATERILEQGKIYFLIFIFAVTNGASIIFGQLAMNQFHAQFTIIGANMGLTVILVLLMDVTGVIESISNTGSGSNSGRESITFSFARFRSALIPAVLHLAVVRNTWYWYKQNNGVLVICYWMVADIFLNYILKKYVFGDYTPSLATSYTESRKAVSDDDDGAEVDNDNGDGNEEDQESAGKDSERMELMRNFNVNGNEEPMTAVGSGGASDESAKKNYAPWLMAKIGVNIRRPYNAKSEMWAYRAVLIATFCMWAQTVALEQRRKDLRHRQYFWKHVVLSGAWYFWEMSKEAGKPTIFHKVFEGKKPNILNNVEKTFYMHIIACILCIPGAYYYEHRKLRLDYTVPQLNQLLIGLICWTIPNLSGLLIRQMTSGGTNPDDNGKMSGVRNSGREVISYAYAIAISLVPCIYFYTKSDQNWIQMTILPPIAAYGYRHFIAYDKRPFYPGQGFNRT